MQRVVWVKMEYRDNQAFPIKTVERLAVIEDNDDPAELEDILVKWASDTAKSLALTMSMSKADVKKLRQSAIRNLIT